MSDPLYPKPPLTSDEPADTDALNTPTNPNEERPDNDREASSDEDDNEEDEDTDSVEGVDPDLQV